MDNSSVSLSFLRPSEARFSSSDDVSGEGTGAAGQKAPVALTGTNSATALRLVTAPDSRVQLASALAPKPGRGPTQEARPSRPSGRSSMDWQSLWTRGVARMPRSTYETVRIAVREAAAADGVPAPFWTADPQGKDRFDASSVAEKPSAAEDSKQWGMIEQMLREAFDRRGLDAPGWL